jgi:chloramphenicol-sensitive protein RarD
MAAPDTSDAARVESRKGIVFAFTAFLLWGVTAGFYKTLQHVDPFEIIAHRVIWSVPIAAIVLVVIGRTGDIGRALRNPRMVAMMLVTSLLVSSNWFVFVVAVMEGWALEASLGYFINPLVSVLIGMVLLGERLDGWQWLAVALAAAGVAVQTWQFGSPPWIGLFLAVTFAAYGYLRKTIDIGPAQGFLVETGLLLPVALAYAAWLAWSGAGHFLPLADPATSALLVLCGPMTAGPLIFFSAAARRIKLATLGLMQYMAPSMIFLTAVFVFAEPFGTAQLASYLLIWAALVVFSVSALRQDRKARAAA